ncbi:MAG TPA: hypothetical protein VLZ12_07390 [Verrucomicrobiae bacterium]|nr:hypothetical protein [Verrucomicrobiae bacterium]
MKRNGHKSNGGTQPQTLADLIATVSNLTQNEQLSAYIVADMINSRQVRLEGEFRDRRVVVG